MPVQEREHARLQTEIDDCLDYSNIDFLEALRSFVRRRGIWPGRYHYQISLAPFARLWNETNTTRAPLGATDRDIEAAANVLLDMHMQAHHPDQLGNERIWKDSWEDFDHELTWSMWKSPDSIAVTDESSKQYYDKIVNTPGGYLKAPIVPSAQLVIPPWRLTSLRWLRLSRRSGFPVPSVRGGSWSESEDQLSMILGVPALPDHCQSTFAYCVRTEWAYRKMKVFRDGNELSAAEKSAVIEDMYIF